VTDDGFTAEEERLVEALADVVVRGADGRFPGAGSLDLVRDMARRVRDMPMLRPVVEWGLGALADLARARNPAGWAALSRDEQATVVAEFTANDQLFLPAFLFLVYSVYYRHPRVMEALGLEARAPHPKGYTMAPDDWAVLEPVRARGRMYRE
jgi:hypothetical protein